MVVVVVVNDDDDDDNDVDDDDSHKDEYFLSCLYITWELLPQVMKFDLPLTAYGSYWFVWTAQCLEMDQDT